MSHPAVAAPAFLGGAAVSLLASWVLVSRIERLGRRFALSQAIVGLLAALAGDSPEITSAVTALAHHDRAVGAGVVLGSNVFNLAALLGLGAVVGGVIALHRRVVAFSGLTALWVAGVSLLAVLGVLPLPGALLLALAGLVPYVLLLALTSTRIHRLPLPPRWCGWLAEASVEEQLEVEAGMHPSRRGRRDAGVIALALLLVVVASVVMEQAATALGSRFAVPSIVTGGIVLAAVTSVPNAVAAVYLARRRHGIAVLSTALNSNTLNTVAGFLLPGVVAGVATSSTAVLVAAWYLGLSALAIGYAYRDAALRRGVGVIVIAAYAAFVVALVVATRRGDFQVGVVLGPGAAGLLVAVSLVARWRRPGLAAGRRASRPPGGRRLDPRPSRAGTSPPADP